MKDTVKQTLADLTLENENLKNLLQEQKVELGQKDEELGQQKIELGQQKVELAKKDEELYQKDEELYQNRKQIDVLSKKVDEQAFRIKELERMKFGHSRERFVDANQLSLFNSPKDAEVEAAVETAKKQIEAEEETITYNRRKPAPRGEGITFSGEVEEQHITLEPEENVEGMTCIGEEVTLKINYQPAKLTKVYYHRKKYITAEDESGHCVQHIAPLTGEIDKCMASPNLLANIAVSKFVDHQPLYRQLKIFARCGAEIPTSTFESWMRICSRTLKPLYGVQKLAVLQQDYLQVDESPIPVLDHDNPKSTHRGFMWVYHAVMSKIVYFEYQKGRGGKFPRENLKNFKGYLQTDGYAGYLQFEERKEITHVGCWAHVRRKFEHALDNDREHATIILRWIQQLYDIERDAKKKQLLPEEIKALRLDKALPIINLIGKYITQERSQVLPQSPMGKAFAYCTDRWTTLSNYILNGQLNMDNNLVENAIRPLALGRKNYLFAGSHEAAEDIAMYYSFFATCRLHNINPEKWLTYALQRLTDAKPSEYINLLPSNIAPELLK